MPGDSRNKAFLRQFEKLNGLPGDAFSILTEKDDLRKGVRRQVQTAACDFRSNREIRRQHFLLVFSN